MSLYRLFFLESGLVCKNEKKIFFLLSLSVCLVKLFTCVTHTEFLVNYIYSLRWTFTTE